jgi:hypothetical protein
MSRSPACLRETVGMKGLSARLRIAATAHRSPVRLSTQRNVQAAAARFSRWRRCFSCSILAVVKGCVGVHMMTFPTGRPAPMIGLGLLLVMGLLARLPAHAAGCADACTGNEILVKEDAHNCYCQDRDDYAKCVGDAGYRLQKKLSTCEGVLSCLGRNGVHEEVGICAAQLLAGTLAIMESRRAAPATIGSTAVTCGWLTRDALNKAQDCVKQDTSTCTSDALETHKTDMQHCQED